MSAITSNLQSLVANVNYLINEYNQNLVVFDSFFTVQFRILQYTELFQFYVKNKYLAISPSDLIKISTWLNEEWSHYLLNSGQSSEAMSIFVINNQLYFDNG